IEPTLNQPANDTYFSLQYPFSWYNGTDYDSDTVYYILQIGDVSFTEPVTYLSSNIQESSDPTTHSVSGVAEGNYSWRVLSSDLTINSSFTDPRVVAIDSTAPNLTLVSPIEKFLNVSASDTEKEIIFYFDVVESNPLENCTFNLNDTAEPVVNQTLTHINQTENNFTVTLAFGGYNWSINCTDIANNVNTTEAVLSFVAYENFRDKGRTTNFSALDDPTNVSTLVLEDPEYGVINFTDVELGLGAGVNIDSYVSIALNNIIIDGTGVPALNTVANLTLFNLTTTDSYILKDGANCSDACTVIDSTPATYTFSIASAGSYTTAGVPIPPTPPPTPTGGSGGGGGTKALTKSSSFSSEPGQFVLQMKKGAVFFEKMSLVNTGDMALVFDLSHNLGGHVSFLENHFRLEPDEDKRFSVSFSAGDPGIHTGKIVVTAGGLQKVIPVTLEVSSERVLVDAKLEVLPGYAELKPGSPLKAQVTLFNTAQKSVPLVVTYVIKDLDGNIVAEETETFDMLDKKSFVKDFDTSNLKAGQYVTGMNVRYLDSFATSSARFEVKGEPVKKPFIEFKLKWQHVVVIVSLFILITLLKLRSINFRRAIDRKKRELKKYGK
ncbi:MAG: hypothetical protein Q8N77_04205, partial [Nanoarchaeota archaeon]|nr:hypothetical protein [Nanoarchaeota archaeon]